MRTINQKKCPACGMEQDSWSKQEGVLENGALYCCMGCAIGTNCNCKIKKDLL